MQGGTKKPEFAKINPMKKIPAMQEIDERTGEVFNLAESHAILRYLACSRGCADHWYPSNLRKRALVDQYLDQHHSVLRVGVTMSALTLTMPRISGKPIDLAYFNQCKATLHKALGDLEARLSKNNYLCGDKKTIADLSAACELD